MFNVTPCFHCEHCFSSFLKYYLKNIPANVCAAMLSSPVMVVSVSSSYKPNRGLTPQENFRDCSRKRS